MILLPDKTTYDIGKFIIEQATVEYKEYLDENNDVDDVDELVQILDHCTDHYEGLFEWHVGDTDGKAVDWYFQSAITCYDGCISFVLDPNSIIGYWGPKSFIQSALKILSHECIHIAQRDLMGSEKFSTVPSGYTKGLDIMKKTGELDDLKRKYFEDPQELMAHGHDLYLELKEADVDISDDFENYDLLTWEKYRTIFDKNDKIMNRLRKYTTEYWNFYEDCSL